MVFLKSLHLHCVFVVLAFAFAFKRSMDLVITAVYFRQNLASDNVFGLLREGTVTRLTKLGRKEAGFAKVNLCDKCLQLSQEAQMVLTNPDTSMKVMKTADHVLCDKLQPGLKTKVSSFHSLASYPLVGS